MSIKHTLIATVTLISSALLLVSCSTDNKSLSSAKQTGENTASSQSALERIKKSGELRVGLEGNYPPYSFINENNQLDGIEKEIADKIANDLGVKPHFIQTKWDSLIAGVDANRYDIVINNLDATPERQEKYDFSVKYATSHGKIIVARDSPIGGIADVKGKKAAQTPTSNWGKIASENGTTIIPVGDFSQAVDLVTSGRADLTFNDLASFQLYLKEHPDAPIRLLDDEIEPNGCCSVLLPKHAEDLKNAINTSINSHLSDGAFARIDKKYVGLDLTPKK